MVGKAWTMVAWLGVALNAVAHANVAVYEHVPLVLWSNRAMFHARNAYLGGSFDEKETAFVLRNVATRDTNNDFYNVLNHEPVVLPRVEALCVFVRVNLPTSDLAAFGDDSYVRTAVKDSHSSVVVPHTTRTGSLLAQLAGHGESPAVISIDDVNTWIRSPKGVAVLQNDKTDLVVVKVPDTYDIAQTDDKIKQAANALLVASDGLIDFALTGDKGHHRIVSDPFSRRRLASRSSNAVTATTIVCDAGYFIGTTPAGTAFCFSHYVHMTPEVLTAIVFGFFFVFLAYVGLSMLQAIQTPLRYPHHGPPKGKEF